MEAPDGLGLGRTRVPKEGPAGSRGGAGAWRGLRQGGTWGLNRPHISHGTEWAGERPSVSQCVPQGRSRASPLSLQRELGVCQSSAACRMEGATSAAAVLKRSCYYNTGQGTRTHTQLPVRRTSASAHPSAWPQSCPLRPFMSPPGSSWCAGCAGTQPGVPQLWDAAGLGLGTSSPGAGVQHSACLPPGATDIPL